MDAGAIIFDAAGKIRFTNARFARLFDVDASQLSAMTGVEEIEEMLAGYLHDPSGSQVPWKSFLAGRKEPFHDELELTKPAGRVLKRVARPIRFENDEPMGWLELYMDATSERESQARLLQTEKLAVLGQLVSGVAHELNNPLTSIVGYAQLLLSRDLDFAPLSDARKVLEEAARASKIAKNLLYAARDGEPERTPVDLNKIAERTVALRSYEWKVRNISTKSDLARDLPMTAGDPHRLQQAVLNLLVNAEQALEGSRSGGHIEVRTRRLASNRISLEISDDGPGIPPEIASRIFDPFFTTKSSGEGTGLGLSIVQRIVQEHGGQVAFENLPAGGTKFAIDLPGVSFRAHDKHTSEKAPNEKRYLLRGRILIVEDEPTVAQLISDVLSEEGHETEAALDSREALDILSHRQFDVVICDLRMPRLDGPAFREELVKMGSPLQDRILFITGDTLGPQSREFLQKNAFPCLAKPFLVEELKIAVDRLLEQWRGVSKTDPKGFAKEKPQAIRGSADQ
jgi:two-component system NtrC family sensor kinase